MTQSILIIIFIIIKACSGFFENCDNQIDLEEFETQTIRSPNFPLHYSPGSSCRYSVHAPSTFNVKLKCFYHMERTNFACSTEYLRISSDDSKLKNAELFCGLNYIKSTSTFNQLYFGYTSTSTIKSGSFWCSVEAVPEKNCDCGWTFNSKIVGGTDATPNQFPPYAVIFDEDTTSILCGGTIINYRYILSAAHCYLLVTDPAKILARVGEQDLSQSADSSYTKDYSILKIISNTDYEIGTELNDIALLQTVVDIEYNRGVGPACLPYKFRSETFDDDFVTITGFGTLQFGGLLPDILQTAQVQVITNTECAVTYTPIVPSQICTYTPGIDSCQFDSGGPLFYIEGRIYVVGVISYGTACATLAPSVNTRVTSFLSWIASNSNDDYCMK